MSDKALETVNGIVGQSTDKLMLLIMLLGLVVILVAIINGSRSSRQRSQNDAKMLDLMGRSTNLAEKMQLSYEGFKLLLEALVQRSGRQVSVDDQLHEKVDKIQKTLDDFLRDCVEKKETST